MTESLVEAMSESGAKSRLKPSLVRYVPTVTAASLALEVSPVAPMSAMSPTFATPKFELFAMRATVPPSSSTPRKMGKPMMSW